MIVRIPNKLDAKPYILAYFWRRTLSHLKFKWLRINVDTLSELYSLSIWTITATNEPVCVSINSTYYVFSTPNRCHFILRKVAKSGKTVVGYWLWYHSFQCYTEKVLHHSKFHFKVVKYEIVKKLLLGLSLSTAVGLDGISPRYTLLPCFGLCRPHQQSHLLSTLHFAIQLWSLSRMSSVITRHDINTSLLWFHTPPYRCFIAYMC